MATHEHDPTDVNASLVTSAHPAARVQNHQLVSQQGILKVSNIHTSPTVGSSSLGLTLIPFVLASIFNYVNIQMSKCQQLSYLITYSITYQIRPLISISLFPPPWTRTL